MISTQKEILIDETEPFLYCKFERKNTANILENVLSYTKENAVVNLTAPWGYGKTTFLKMFQKKLLNSRTTCIYFSAWEYDYIEDPFSSLIAHLYKELNKNEEIKDKGRMAKVFRTVLPVVGNVGLKLATANMLDSDAVKDAFSSDVDKEISSEVGKIAKNVLNNYLAVSEEISKFKESLEEFALVQPNNHIVIIVDELDRCRPDFAIEMLEKVKHIMSVPGVKFVLGTDKKQLSESIKVLYGSNFDSLKYLERFIDFEYKLEIPSVESYINSLISEFDIFEQVELRKFDVSVNTNLIEMALFLSNELKLDLRTLRQLFFQLHLVIISIPISSSSEQCMNKIFTEYLLFRLAIEKMKIDNNFIKEDLEKSMYFSSNKYSVLKSCALELFYKNSDRKINYSGGEAFFDNIIHSENETRVINILKEIKNNDFCYMRHELLNNILLNKNSFELQN